MATATLESEKLCEAGTVGIDGAIQMTGLSRSSIYDLLKNNTLRSVKIGKRRLILRASITSLLAANILSGPAASAR